VVTDASRVRQVVANLLSNAIKYTDAGSVTLRASRQESGDAQHQSILILVADTGPGIPADKLDSIFEEFSRLSDKQPGAGVGLAISRHLANAIGCTLGVTSEVGKGSAFTLSIPLRVEREEFAPAERELAAHGRGGDGPVPGRAD
jgi:signal transduction histidine kinase